MKRKPIEEEAGVLRQWAEGTLAARPTAVPRSDEVDSALHELQVHQIELEMQNETLRRAQVELDATRARYFELYDQAPVGYVTLSEPGVILEANATAATLLGVTKEQLVRQPLTRFILAADQDIYYRYHRRLCGAGGPQACELRLLRAGADPVWVHVDAAVARDANGAPVCRVVLSRISERKRAEEALRTSDARYRGIFSHSPSALCELDTSGLMAVIAGLAQDDASQALARLTTEGPPRAAALQGIRLVGLNEAARRFFGIAVEGDLDDVAVRAVGGVLARLLLTDAACVLAGKTSCGGEARVTLPAGGDRYVLWRWARDEGPTDLQSRHILSLVDRTEATRAAEALRESQEQFRVAQELSPDGFTILRPVRDAQGRVADFTWVYENATIGRLNGTEPKAVVGRRLLELFPGHRGSAFLRAYQEVAESGENRVFEAEYGGESLAAPTWFRVVVVPMGGDIAILAQDITARKRADEVLRASREQLRVLASRIEAAREEERTTLARDLHDGLAQELTRLKIDLLMLRGRMRKPGDAAAYEAMALRLTEMARIADTAIESVQRVATGLRPALLDSLGLCAAVAWQAAGFADHSGVPCQANVPDEEVVADRAVATAAFRILQESLTNVERYAQATRVQVTLRQEAGHLVLRIEDNGCGMGRETLVSPLSVGLTGMRERAFLLGGRCEVRSQPGAGTTVDVTLPLWPNGTLPPEASP